MLDYDVIYRVIYSPTEHAYAAATGGTDVAWHDTFKQAARRHGKKPLKIVTAADFDALRFGDLPTDHPARSTR